MISTSWWVVLRRKRLGFSLIVNMTHFLRVFFFNFPLLLCLFIFLTFLSRLACLYAESFDKSDDKQPFRTTAQTYWQSSAEIWECQRNRDSLKNEVDKDAISCFSIRKDWRFTVRAKSFALHWRSRGFFSGSRAQLWERSIDCVWRSGNLKKTRLSPGFQIRRMYEALG